MVEENTSNFGTAFTVSIEARGQTTTGISAADRAATVLTRDRSRDAAAGPAAPGPHVPAAGAARRRAEARRARPRPRSTSRGSPGSTPAARHLRDHERGRHDGARARPREVLRSGTACRSSRSPTSSATGCRPSGSSQRIASPHLPTRFGEFRVVAYRSDVTHEEHLALVHGEMRGGRADPRARPLAVPDGRRLRLGALRLRRAARARDGEDRRRGPRRPPLPPAGGARHRPLQQAQGLRAPGPGPRHGRGQREARLPARHPRLRRRVPDPARPRRAQDAPHDEQPVEVRRDRRLRPRDRRARARSRSRRPTARASTSRRRRTRWGTC